MGISPGASDITVFEEQHIHHKIIRIFSNTLFLLRAWLPLAQSSNLYSSLWLKNRSYCCMRWLREQIVLIYALIRLKTPPCIIFYLFKYLNSSCLCGFLNQIVPNTAIIALKISPQISRGRSLFSLLYLSLMPYYMCTSFERANYCFDRQRLQERWLFHAHNIF